jgi:hypothetical protein
VDEPGNAAVKGTGPVESTGAGPTSLFGKSARNTERCQEPQQMVGGAIVPAKAAIHVAAFVLSSTASPIATRLKFEFSWNKSF